MSFLQSSNWTFTSKIQNPETFNNQGNLRKTSYDCSNLSTRKDSNDSIDFKFKYKTQVCKYWVNGELCPFENFCAFAHGFVQRRSRQDLPSKYKTKHCKNFLSNSFCPYGMRCQFLHPKKLKQEQIFQNKYQNLLSLASQSLPLFFQYTSKRLQFFRSLSDNETMKQLLGEQYNSQMKFNLLQKLILNGKPRFYSI